LITIPVSGYIFTTFTGQNVSIFNTFDIPAVLVTSEKIRDLAIQFHIYASYGIAVVVFVHAGGALKHHLLDKDRTLRRMLW
jgi:cytochrome b561